MKSFFLKRYEILVIRVFAAAFAIRIRRMHYYFNITQEFLVEQETEKLYEVHKHMGI